MILFGAEGNSSWPGFPCRNRESLAPGGLDILRYALRTAYTTHQAAEILGVSRSTLLRWFREGRIPAVARDHNGWRRLSENDLQKIRNHLQGGPSNSDSGGNPRLRAYLRKVPMFSSLPNQVLDPLAEHAQFQGLLRGQHLFVPGDVSRGLYIVVKGRVRVYRMSLEGREQTLRVAVPFQTLGESQLFQSRQRYGNYALCQESSTVLVLPLGRLLALTDAHPPLAQAFLREFAQRIYDLEERLEETALWTLEQRVARLLLEAESMSIPARPRELAAYLGAARESVSRVLLRFAREGLVGRKDGEFYVLDRSGLDSV